MITDKEALRALTDKNLSFIIRRSLMLDYSETGGSPAVATIPGEYLWLSHTQGGSAYFYDMRGYVGKASYLYAELEDRGFLSMTEIWIDPKLKVLGDVDNKFKGALARLED